MGIARNIARLVPNGSGLLPNANIEAVATSKLTGQVPDANAPSGSVIQVVSATKTDTFTSNTYATWVDVTGLSVSITPISSSNKILVFANVQYGGTSQSTGLALRCLRGSTPIGNADAAGSRISAFYGTEEFGPVGIYQMFTTSFNNLDSPATTSSTTYKIQLNLIDNYGTAVINRCGYDGDTSAFARGSSTITVMEIAA